MPEVGQHHNFPPGGVIEKQLSQTESKWGLQWSLYSDIDKKIMADAKSDCLKYRGKASSFNRI